MRSRNSANNLNSNSFAGAGGSVGVSPGSIGHRKSGYSESI